MQPTSIGDGQPRTLPRQRTATLKRPKNTLNETVTPRRVAPRFDEPTVLRLRKRLMAKGHAIATLLADVLGGKDRGSEIRALQVDDKPGERVDEKLRRYLDLLESRRQLLDARSEAYGCCELCGLAVELPALEEMPWADRCMSHPITAAG